MRTAFLFYLNRLKKERFSPRFIISRIFFRLGITLPWTLIFSKKYSILTKLHPSSAAHKLFIQKYKPNLDIAVFEKFIGQGDTVFDVGANIGMFSILSARLSNTGRVFSFEPTVKTFFYLLENVEINHVKNIFPFKVAVSDHAGVKSFFEHVYSQEQNRLVFEGVGNAAVQTVRLDSFMEMVGIDSVDFLKIDVEGAELSVLHSLGKKLKQVRTIYLEFSDSNYRIFGYTQEHMVQFLENQGFSVFVPSFVQGLFCISPLTDMGESVRNIIATREDVDL